MCLKNQKKNRCYAPTFYFPRFFCFSLLNIDKRTPVYQYLYFVLTKLLFLLLILLYSPQHLPQNSLIISNLRSMQIYYNTNFHKILYLIYIILPFIAILSICPPLRDTICIQNQISQLFYTLKLSLFFLALLDPVLYRYSPV